MNLSNDTRPVPESQMPTRSREDLIAEIQSLQAALNDDGAPSRPSRESRRRLALMEAVMETVPVGVVLADETGRIVHGNSLVEEMVRHPVLHSADAESYGEWISYHADGRRVESHEYPLARVIRDGEERSVLDVHYQRGDGTRFWMRIIGQPVRDEDGALIGATVALVDIDEERRLEEAQSLLIAELNHRVKNAVSVVKSIVSQSLRKGSVPRGLRETIDRRLDAYAGAHARLIGRDWDSATLRETAEEVLTGIGDGRIVCDGPDLVLPARQALAMSMAFYELATNAVKYGALSVPEGRVALSWNLTNVKERCLLDISWTETGGPAPTAPTEKGFGSFVTGRALQFETSGKIETGYPASGFQWRLTMPLEDEPEEAR